MRKVQRPVAIAITIGIVVASSFVMNQQETKDKKEAFAVNRPTRLNDCTCLPGYIPSKRVSTKYEGFVASVKDLNSNARPTFYYILETKEAYRINPSNSCGIDVTNPDIQMSTSDFRSKNYKEVGTLSCSLVKEASDRPFAFCQSTTNKTLRKECY